MKVKVKKCSNPIWWYAGMIGQEFDVVNELKDDYEVSRGERGVSYLILKEDCEEISNVVLSGTIGMETSKEPSGFKTIKMSLDTAREWYKLAKQNESNNTQPAISWLLENFTKEELEPKKGFTWEESFNGAGFYTAQGMTGIAAVGNYEAIKSNQCLFKTKEQAESALAFAQLTHIVAKYNEGKKKGNGYYYSIYRYRGVGDLIISHGVSDYLGISFVDEEDAKTSMEVNKGLWKQYWMIK